jgi:hypothetical protein
VFDGEIGQEEKGGKDRLLRQEAIGRPGQEQVQLAQVQVGCQVHQQAGHRSDRLRQAPGGFTRPRWTNVEAEFGGRRCYAMRGCRVRLWRRTRDEAGMCGQSGMNAPLLGEPVEALHNIKRPTHTASNRRVNQFETDEASLFS